MATVHPAEKFSYAVDGEKIRSGMKGFGTDEQAIIAILTRISHSQRMLIVKYFEEEYNRDVLEELKEELGEKLDDLTYALVTSTVKHFCYALNSLLEAENLDERALIEIVCTRSSDEIKSITKEYPISYERSLVGHIGKATPARQLASAIINGANNDQSAEEVIKAETSDELKAIASIATECLGNPLTFFANSLNQAFEGKVNHKTLSRIIVSRSEIDLANIKEEYKRLFDRTLASDVKSKSSDDYKKPLTALIGDA